MSKFGRSFDKVQNTILKGAEWEAFIQHVIRILDGVNKPTFTATYTTGNSARREVSVEFISSYNKQEVYAANQRYLVPNAMVISYSRLFSEKDINGILSRFKSGGIPTYNCSYKKMTEFLSMNMTELLLKNMQVTLAAEAAQRRMAASYAEAIQNGEDTAVVQAAYERDGIKAVREVLMKFKDLPKHALKQALDEFIIHELTED